MDTKVITISGLVLTFAVSGLLIFTGDSTIKTTSTNEIIEPYVTMLRKTYGDPIKVTFTKDEKICLSCMSQKEFTQWVNEKKTGSKTMTMAQIDSKASVVKLNDAEKALLTNYLK